MDNIQIFEMNLEDLNQIANSLLTDFDDFWSIGIFKSELENPMSKYIVAKIDSAIVGFAGILDAVDQIHITNIVVKKDFRNKGIGDLLLKALIQMTNKLGKTSLTLEVRESNEYAKKLYLKNGFEILGIRKNYYNNAENAIIMTLYL